MKVRLGFDHDFQEIEVADEALLAVLTPKELPKRETFQDPIQAALTEPIESPLLRACVRSGEKIVIITSDITRPFPSARVIPGILEELAEAGVEWRNVSIVFALGIHRSHSRQEQRALLGELPPGIEVLDSDPENCLHIGTTSRGTPIEVFKPVAEADRRICLGNIEYHYFAGYSGGAKAILPGVCNHTTIQANHKMMVLPGAQAGRLTGNPVREDIEEILRYLPVDFILNVVLDEKKEIVHAVAGHPIAAHRAGCKYLDSMYSLPIQRQADIVVVSPGGYPKDINLYQAQKALDNAQHAVRPGGIIILVASCKEGLGEATFERWLHSVAKPDQLTTAIRKNFELGGHKAAAIAKVLEKADVYLVSSFAPESVSRIFMKPFDTCNAALQHAQSKLGEAAKIIVIPYGGSILPKIEEHDLHQ